METSILRMVSLIREVTAVPLPVERRPVRVGEAARTSCDVSMARAVLDWEPLVELRHGLGRTYAWLEEASRPSPPVRS